MRIESGTTDQYVYFVAVDATDGITRETGLSTWTVYRSRNGAAAAAMTTPTINETDSTNMPGVYELLLDEDMTIGSGNVTEAMTFHITHAGMAPVTLEIELFSTANDAAISTIDTNVDSILADTGTDGVAISTSTINSIADQVWDEAAADHVAAGSFGGAAFAQVIRSATAQAGAATTITLDASASAVDDFYNNTFVYILSGTGAGQGRFITDYVGSTKVATVDTWITNPDATSVFTISAFSTLPGSSAPTAAQNADAVWDELLSGHTTTGTFGEALGGGILRTATAQAGAASTITLDASASATNDIYNYNIIRIISGTGAGQSRQISDYVGASKVATVSLAWATNPDATSVFQIIALGVDAATVASIADQVWDEARADHVAAGSFGERVLANMTQISGDTTAADNLEAMVDGTGLTLTGVTVPTVTTLTGHTAQTGDAFARLGAPAGASVSADIASVQTDTTAIEADTQDIQSRLPAALVGGLMSSDVTAISTSTAAADNLEANALAAITGTAQTGTLSTTQATTDLTGYVNDELIGRVIVFNSGTANGQAGRITDYASASGLVTFTTIITAPANNDTFVIV